MDEQTDEQTDERVDVISAIFVENHPRIIHMKFQ